MDRFWTFVLRRNSSHPSAVYLALGGTAAAAATLARDSVGSSQIRADAVRPPEIEGGAVRSSEIRDEDIKVADVATAARFALLPDVRVAELEDGLAVPAVTTSVSARTS